jgi:hypothetical protein
MAAMRILECRKIVFDHAAQPFDFDSVCAQRVSVPVAKREDHAGNCEHNGHQNANRRADEKLKLKKLRTEEPLDFATKEAALFPRDNPGFGRG